VITAGNTFIATAFAISQTGATPVLVDINPNTYTIDVMELYKSITEQTKAIIPVHLFGHPADMSPILEIATKKNLIIIEDACQAHGAKYRGLRVGGIGHAAAFSFYPSKNLGAFGDAGMVVTNDVRVNDIVRILRNQGQSRKHAHQLKGHNHRLDNLQAAVLAIKIKYLDISNAARRRNAARYNQLLSGCGAIIPHTALNVEPVYHLYVIRVDHRDELQEYLGKKGLFFLPSYRKR
jgi:dTDP-4-amino-4,6-dideoxygalactose transaminase